MGGKRSYSKLAIGTVGAVASMLSKRRKQSKMPASFYKAGSKSAGARGGTRTGTVTLTKRKTKFVTIRPGGASTSVFAHKSKCPKYMSQIFKSTAAQVYIANSASRLTIPCGQQLADVRIAIDGTTSAGDFSQGDVGQILNQIYGAAPTNAQKTTRLFFKKVTHNHMLTNNQTNTCYVDLYDIVARRDSNRTSTNAWYQGLQDQGLSVGYNAINVTPFMSKDFTTNWKVLKKTSIELPPGATHRHIMTVDLNQAWNAERMQSAVSQYAGLTHGTLIVSWGAPDHDATGVANVSTGSVLLDVVRSKQIEYFYDAPQSTNTRYSTLLSTITTERAVDGVSGAAATVAS